MGEFLTAAAFSPEKETLCKKEEWSEDDVESLKCKLRTCRWLRAAGRPREWLAPWAGEAQELWRPSDVALMSEFWLCGAAMPVLDLETQVVFPTEQKQASCSKTLDLLGIREMPATEKIKCAWSQLEAIQVWHDSKPAGESEVWTSKCLYHHVYPLVSEAEAKPFCKIFVSGSFILMEDVSISQDFNVAGLHQVPKELQATSPKLCQQLKPASWRF